MKTSRNDFFPEGLPLVEEVEYRLFINGLYYSNLLCTPYNIEELALGFLYTSGHISSLSDLVKLEAAGDRVNAFIKNSDEPEEASARDSYIELPPLGRLREMARRMFNAASIYKKYGGIHCSAFTDGTQLVAFMEDIGRHNAFDKVVGELLQKGLNPANLIYLTSGRVNHEVMQKTIACRIPAVVSRSICSSSAYKAALDNRIIVIGRILDNDPVIYSSLESRRI